MQAKLICQSYTQVVHASTPGFPVRAEAALTVDAGDVRVSTMTLVQQPDPRVPLHLLPLAAVAARLAEDQSGSCLAAVQTAVTMCLRQQACCEPLAVRALFRSQYTHLQRFMLVFVC